MPSLRQATGRRQTRRRTRQTRHRTHSSMGILKRAVRRSRPSVIGGVSYGPELGLVRLCEGGPFIRSHGMSTPLRNLGRSIRDDRPGNRKRRALRVSVLGSPELFADRTVALLTDFGVDARRPKLQVGGSWDLRSRLALIRLGLATDVFLYMSGRPSLSRLQGVLGRLGIPTIFLWIGSDILIRAPEASNRVIDQAWHWCRAPWAQDELSAVGIEAEIALMSPPRIPAHVPPLPSRFTVLAYALDGRSDLYGTDLVIELARRRPDIPFILMAATRSEGWPDNVTALGWVEDPEEAIARSTLYVRPTSHDGLAYLVLEALASGRHVLWTYPFPGVESFDTVDAAEALLNELYRHHVEGRLSLNHEGREAVLKMFEPAAVRNEMLERLKAVTEQGWRRPPGRLQRWIAQTILRTLRMIFRADQSWTASGEPPA